MPDNTQQYSALKTFQNLNLDKILIVSLSSIGDVINTIPVASILRKTFPNSFIAWLVEDKAKNLIENNKYLNKVFVYERKKISKTVLSSYSFLMSCYKLIQDIRSYNFTIVLDLQSNLKSGVFTALSKSPHRAGFGGLSKEFAHIFTNIRCTPSSPYMHRLDRCLELLNQLNINTSTWDLGLQISNIDIKNMDDFLSEKNISRFCIFHPGTSEYGSFKRWPIENYVELTNLVNNQYKIPVIITWNDHEEDMANQIIRHSVGSIYKSFRTHSLMALSSLLARADFFVGSDSAPLHLSALLGIPTVGLYGPKDTRIYRQYSQKSAIVRVDLPCSPCWLRKCRHSVCMSLITPQDVITAIKNIYSPYTKT